MKKKKISELPECTSFKGLWTIGVDIFNKSVKVSLEYIQSVVDEMKSATKNATNAASSANSAAQTANNAAQGVQAATTAANTATTNANNATAAAIEAKENCEEVIAAAAELEPLNLIPTAMTVEYPSRLLIGNMAENFIRATLAPASVKPNVLFLGDDKAVSVTPDGRITILAAGTSIIHVIPTCNVALYKTIQIKVSEPTIRLVTLSSIRLTANGNFRFN
ncbi:hypothetical protein [uncultured Alistipes sp.]|uniref:hypothetical protein n=1 Tax=uncultured Alistipes sp. TaxID=538949 RepID=UPI0026761EAE|nr:hypothetical protein [uncultured Alistipes sp.]